LRGQPATQGLVELDDRIAAPSHGLPKEMYKIASPIFKLQGSFDSCSSTPQGVPRDLSHFKAIFT
jgi:hypothetical protein